MIYTDNKDFYPTPASLFRQLTRGIRHLDGRILEPSAGKGDMIKHILGLSRSKSVKIDAIEIDPRLQANLIGEGFNVVWDDFLTYETYKEYDYIFMNPPFSKGVEHMLKALELAEKQLSYCEIYAILNKETLNNAYSSKRQELLRKLDEHGAEIEYVKDAFVHAERRTDVEVALIRVKVEKANKGRSIYDSIPFFTADREQTKETLETSISTFVKKNEIETKMNDIKRLIIEYETACELLKEYYEAYTAKSSFLSYIGEVNKREGESVSPFNYVIKKEYSAHDLNEELDRLRREYWRLILDTDEFSEILTNEARQKLNRQLSAANEMEINLPNIRMLLMAISANREEMLVDSIVSIFERITKYHMNQYSSNIHYYNGWKTNSAYKINKKIIIPIRYSPFDSWDFKEEYDRLPFDIKSFVDDLVKAFQLINPRFNNKFEYKGDATFENDLLRFKMFKNGNIHIWFNDLDALNKLNYICGQHFNWIPSEGEQKESEEARRWVAKEFGDIGEVKLLQA